MQKWACSTKASARLQDYNENGRVAFSILRGRASETADVGESRRVSPISDRRGRKTFRSVESSGKFSTTQNVIFRLIVRRRRFFLEKADDEGKILYIMQLWGRLFNSRYSHQRNFVHNLIISRTNSCQHANCRFMWKLNGMEKLN